jgi:hypothetical protein
LVSLVESLLSAAPGAQASRVLALGTSESTNHGGQCSCTALARACGVPPETVSYEYCTRVLRKHWTVTCRHGGHPPECSAPPPVVGPLDQISGLIVSRLYTGQR